MILIASNTIPNCDSVPQSINLEGSDIKHAITVRNLGVCLDSTFSFQKAHLLHLSYILYENSSDLCNMPLSDQRCHPQNYCVRLFFSRLDYCSSRLAGCPKYLLSKLQKLQNNATRLIFRTTRSVHVTPILHSLH